MPYIWKDDFIMIARIRILWYSRRLKKIPISFNHYLSKYSQYYRDLHPDLQKSFRERTYIASKMLVFKPVKFSIVTDEMKILITSALIQITFGLDNYVLRRFNTILVVPNTYGFQEYDALLGHVDFDENKIVMSWPSVQEGFIIPDDAFNVAIHELAHALQGEQLDPNPFSNFFSSLKMNQFEEEGIKELYKIRRERRNFLSDYAGTNMKELFATCMECFFEQPNEFKEKVPKLFKIMSELLKQDTTLVENPLLNQ